MTDQHHFVLLKLIFQVLLENFIYPDTVYENYIVNRNITKLTQQECHWIRGNCGWFKKYVDLTFKILDGEIVKPAQMPWVVLVTTAKTQFLVDEKGNIKQETLENSHCTGTLISKKHVITAAHCLLNRIVNITKKGNITTYQGINKDLTSNGLYGTSCKSKIMIGVNSDIAQYRNETARFLSPYLLHKSGIFDYAIIEFEPPLERKDMAIAWPACLPLKNPNIEIGMKLLVAGWGVFDEETEAVPNHLLFSEVTREECEKPRFENDVICTEYTLGEGDSGAGLIKMETTDTRRVIIVGVESGCYDKHYKICRCYDLPWWTYKQDAGILLNPEDHRAFLVPKPITVITEQLGCTDWLIVLFRILLDLVLAEFTFPDTEHMNGVVNRNISQISKEDCKWLRKNCGIVRKKSLYYKPQFKILGGEPVKPGQMPWTALVTIKFARRVFAANGTEEKDKCTVYQTACTGTLISKQHLITSAHCFHNEVITTNKKGNTVTNVVPYDINMSSSGQYGTIFKSKIIFGVNSNKTLIMEEKARFLSSDYARSYIFDYAILEFYPPLKKKDLKFAMPACLPLKYVDIAIGTKLLMAGWGEIDKSGTIVDQLLFREVTRVECYRQIIRNDMICTDFVATEGDSGAGLIKMEDLRAVLIGVLSTRICYRKRCLIWPYVQWPWDYHQNRSPLLNPQQSSPFPGVLKPIDVITEKIGCMSK